MSFDSSFKQEAQHQHTQTLEQQFSTLGPWAVAFVGSNSLLAGQVKAWPGALTGEMLSQVTGCRQQNTRTTCMQPPGCQCVEI
jgi:hypothetical protein